MSVSRQSKILITMWSLGGFVIIIWFAMSRLLPRAIEVLNYNLSTIQIVILVSWVLFMVWSESYDGFYKRFAPRFAARVIRLFKEPRTIYLVLAPLYCMHYFAAPRHRIIVAWAATGLIICAILLIRLLPSPWRNIIDVGVVTGLMFGTIVTIFITVFALRAELKA